MKFLLKLKVCLYISIQIYLELYSSTELKLIELVMNPLLLLTSHVEKA